MWSGIHAHALNIVDRWLIYQALAIGIPGILIAALGIPLMGFCVMWAKRNRLHDPKVLCGNGLLYCAQQRIQ